VIAADVVRCDGLPIGLAGIAAKFQPHITLWGRFEPSAGQDWEAFVASVGEAVEDLVFPRLILAGPRAVGEDMIWYESDPGAPGFETLRSVHHSLGRRLNRLGLIGADLLPTGFRGAGYRPHLTAAWAAAPNPLMTEHTLEVKVSALCLYSYDHLPRDGAVTRRPLRAVET
jgi:hypothetical protein